MLHTALKLIILLGSRNFNPKWVDSPSSYFFQKWLKPVRMRSLALSALYEHRAAGSLLISAKDEKKSVITAVFLSLTARIWGQNSTKNIMI